MAKHSKKDWAIDISRPPEIIGECGGYREFGPGPVYHISIVLIDEAGKSQKIEIRNIESCDLIMSKAKISDL